MGFLTVILFIILFFYLLGFIGRILLRRWILNKQREFEQNGQSGGFSFRQYTWGAGNNQSQQKSAREGEIKIQKTAASQQKKVSKNVGDYVDYQEIKEDKE